MNDRYKLFRRLILVFIIVVVGFVIYDVATFEVPAPDFSPLNISREAVIENFEKLGFTFTTANDSLFGQPLSIGLSGDKNATIHLIGQPENLVSIKIVTRLSKKFSKAKLKSQRRYLEQMIGFIYPDWAGGNQWLEKNALGIRGSGKRSILRNNKRLTLRLSNKYLTMGLTIGNWDKLPRYNLKQHAWTDFE